MALIYWNTPEVAKTYLPTEVVRTNETGVVVDEAGNPRDVAGDLRALLHTLGYQDTSPLPPTPDPSPVPAPAPAVQVSSKTTSKPDIGTPGPAPEEPA